MSTKERMSQPAAIASRAARPEKMLSFTLRTANTIATAPKVDIWKRCMAMESVARVCTTPRMRKSWRKMANQGTPTFPTGGVSTGGGRGEGRTLGGCDGLGYECDEPGELWGGERDRGERGDTHDGEDGGEEEEVVGEDGREVEAVVSARRHLAGRSTPRARLFFRAHPGSHGGPFARHAHPGRARPPPAQRHRRAQLPRCSQGPVPGQARRVQPLSRHHEGLQERSVSPVPSRPRPLTPPQNRHTRRHRPRLHALPRQPLPHTGLQHLPPPRLQDRHLRRPT